MMARVFWGVGAGLFVLAMLLMVSGGPEHAGIIDYRAWLLLGFGVLAGLIGNFSRPSGHDDWGGGRHRPS